MACDAMTGACGSFDGAGMVALGSLCDSDDDCGAGAEGSVRLRHGEMPASQGAHWSTYYGASPLGAPPAGKEAVGEGGPLPSQCTRVGTTAGTLPCPPQRRSRARPKC